MQPTQQPNAPRVQQMTAGILEEPVSPTMKQLPTAYVLVLWD
jgi:hypothetical protein